MLTGHPSSLSQSQSRPYALALPHELHVQHVYEIIPATVVLTLHTR